MITKIAILGATLGAVRANNLTEKEKEELVEEHRMHPRANFRLRNAGRGFMGEAAGGILGSVAGSPGMTVGSVVGSILATNKYSPGALNKIRKKELARGVSSLIRGNTSIGITRSDLRNELDMRDLRREIQDLKEMKSA